MQRVFFSPGQSVALFGGSFDPPHEGHRLVAEAALKALQVDFVWWLVAPQNPLKAHRPQSLKDRLTATRKIANHPRFIVSDEENRLGTRFAIDTVRALQKNHPQTRFIWLIGADNLRQMHRWRNWQALLQNVPVAVYPRPGDTVKAAFAPAAQRFAAARIDGSDGPKLARQKAPAWLVLPGATSPLASSHLRRASEAKQS